MIEFRSGAVTLGRLFVAFAVAFVLLALNQALAFGLGDADERVGYTYLLRILGYLLILGAIVDKNFGRRS